MKANESVETALKYSMMGVLLAITLLAGLTLSNDAVIGVNITNVTTRVNVTNTQPIIQQVNLTPANIVLLPGNTSNATCVASVFDFNGVNDFLNASAVFYLNSTGPDGPDDNNNHYTVDNLSCEKTNINATHYHVTCNAPLEYYADNGTWGCQMTVTDNGGAQNPDAKLNASQNASIFANVTELLALDVPSVLDFGNLTVTQTSDATEFNITNFGNIDINISVRGFGATVAGDNLSMVCAFGEIPIELERFALDNATLFDDMTAVTNVTTLIQNFTLPQRTDDNDFGADRNQTYWRLQIPLSVGGDCNGTLVFSASQAQ